MSTAPEAPEAADYCCPTFKGQIECRCEQHDAEGVTCPDVAVYRSTTSGLLFLNAPNATYTLRFCPWCGAQVQQDPSVDEPATGTLARRLDFG